MERVSQPESPFGELYKNGEGVITCGRGICVCVCVCVCVCLFGKKKELSVVQKGLMEQWIFRSREMKMLAMPQAFLHENKMAGEEFLFFFDFCVVPDSKSFLLLIITSNVTLKT